MTGLDPSEFTLNRALQKANLGEFAEADRLFADALALPTSDPVQLRLRRNFRAIHALNQQDYDSAAPILRAPVPPLTSAVAVDGTAVVLTPEIAAGINSDASARAVRQASDEDRLTPPARATIIDAQAPHLLGTTLRLRGDAQAAQAADRKSHRTNRRHSCARRLHASP